MVGFWGRKLVENTLSQQTFHALARELKEPLVNISRQAELLNISKISQQANSAMTLVDGFLLSAQSDYGQLQFDLEPIDVGSILYNISCQYRESTLENQIEVELVLARDNLIMANRRALEVSLGCLMQLAIDQNYDESRKSLIRLVSFKKRNGNVMTGILSTAFSLNAKDLARAEKLYGHSHLATNTSLNGSGIRIAVAEQLMRSLGTRLISLKRNNLRGLGIEFIKSEQLSLRVAT